MSAEDTKKSEEAKPAEGGIFGTIGSGLSWVGNSVVDAGKAVGNGVVSVGSAVGNTVVDAGKAVGNGVVKVGSAVGEGVVSAGKTVGNGVVSVGSAAANGVASAGSAVGGAVGIKKDEAKAEDKPAAATTAAAAEPEQKSAEEKPAEEKPAESKGVFGTLGSGLSWIGNTVADAGKAVGNGVVAVGSAAASGVKNAGSAVGGAVGLAPKEKEAESKEAAAAEPEVHRSARASSGAVPPSNFQSPQAAEEEATNPASPRDGPAHARTASVAFLKVPQPDDAKYSLNVFVNSLGGVHNKHVYLNFRVAMRDAPDIKLINTALPSIKTSTLPITHPRIPNFREWNVEMPNLWVSDPESQLLVVEVYSVPNFKAKKYLGFADFPIPMSLVDNKAVVESDFETYSQDPKVASTTFGKVVFHMQLSKIVKP